MMADVKSTINFEKKLLDATEYLKSLGAKEIILFGSLADGTFDQRSDIDLAVSGISPKAYFTAIAILPSLIEWKVDLVAIDHARKDFAAYIRKYGKVIYAV
jgi:predicted nucleotidyltransferase